MGTGLSLCCTPSLRLSQVLVCKVCDQDIDPEPVTPQPLAGGSVAEARLAIGLCPSCNTMLHELSHVRPDSPQAQLVSQQVWQRWLRVDKRRKGAIVRV